MIKIAFFGTPDYVLPVLSNLHKEFRMQSESPIVAVVTQEPKVSGRDKLKTFSPIDTWAYQRKKPVFFDPADIIKNNIGADIGVLASFGKIIPDSVIKHFRYGIINIHPSLLPSWRGSSPVQASIMSGDKVTGVTFMKLDVLLDHGPIISQFREEISEIDNTITLRKRLFERASEVITGLIPAYMNGKTKLKVQDHEKATFTKQLKREDGFIPPKYLKAVLKGTKVKDEWEIPFMKEYKTKYNAETVNNFIRAVFPWPGAWTKVVIKKQSLRLKIISAHLTNDTKNPERKMLNLDEVQLEGKSPVSWKQFSEGYPGLKFA